MLHVVPTADDANADLSVNQMTIAPAETASFRAILRDATRPRHDETDHTFSLLDLSSRKGLGTFLAASLIALGSLEERLSNAEGLPPLPPRLPLLAADLADLGLPLPEAARGELSAHDPLGLAYVVGGSSLGTRVLRQRWQSADDPIVAKAGRYLSDGRIGLYWKELRDHHLTRPADPTRIAGVVTAANAAFDIYRLALRRAASEVAHG